MKSVSPKLEAITLDPNDPELYKKKSKIEKMIMYYKMKKTKAEEKVYSTKNIISEAYDEMEKIKVKG